MIYLARLEGFPYYHRVDEPPTDGLEDHFEGFPQLADFIKLSYISSISPVHLLFLLLLLCSLFLKCGHKYVTGSNALVVFDEINRGINQMIEGRGPL